MDNPYVAAGATILSAAGQFQQGQAQAGALKVRAQQEDLLAGQAFASSQRRAQQATREANLISNAVTARAAASGGSATDPTVQNIQARVQGQGEYNALSALYEGREAQAGLQLQAGMDRAVAGSVSRAGLMRAGATILTGANDLATKYGWFMRSGKTSSASDIGNPVDNTDFAGAFGTS